jgi:hypothetical protein
MTLVLVLVVVLATAILGVGLLAAAVAAGASRLRRSEDWWPEFERDFWDYAAQSRHRTPSPR